VLVIGCGEAVNGSIEIVAYESRLGLCVFIDALDRGSGSGTCGVTPATDGNAIDVTSLAFEHGRHKRFTPGNWHAVA
jgi:hypothetical protein